MKKNKLKILAVLIILIISLIVLFIKSISYTNRIEEDFKININDFKIEKKSEREEWLPNGDGMKFIIIEYDTLNINTLKDFKNLPIKETLPSNDIPIKYLRVKKGYYKYIIDKEDNRNFKILIIDILKKEIYVYYQIM